MGLLNDGGWGQKGPLPKIYHTYPTMMKLGTVLPYFFGSLKVVLINMVAVLMLSAKLATLGLLKIKFEINLK